MAVVMKDFFSISDSDFLHVLREKDFSEWDGLYERFDPMIEAILAWRKWGFTEHEQQDVKQNVYLQLQKALPTFRQECSLERFVKLITMRQCINEVRRQVRWRNVMRSTVQQSPEGVWSEMEIAGPQELNPRWMVLKRERKHALKMALKELQETCRTSIELFYVKELSYREISEKLGISVNTVGSRLAKCLNKLHKELRKQPLFAKEGK